MSFSDSRSFWRPAFVIALLVVVLAGSVIAKAPLEDWVVRFLTVDEASLTLVLLVALYFLVSQLIIVPLGTVSLMLAGAFVGWWSGLIYFAAMLVAGAVLFGFARAHPRRARRFVWRFVSGAARRAATRLLRHIQNDTLTATAALRLFPVMPSAGCTLLVGACGGDFRGFMVGTGLTGWIRPLAFAILGAQLGQLVANPASASTSVPLIALVAAGSLGLVGIIYLIWLRRAPRLEPR
ncbi:VTT domain-containing protein [uncultured Maricaulis sp.]|uniref:VTT domain-containing protein n=1 Tax=uncultured Maricaulis sp. TaxID=174710 RepID=UPI0030DC5B75|tara:strand:- start:56 stop:766 length:711 start_codon:yes stop_codon:yes gene_type:complete